MSDEQLRHFSALLENLTGQIQLVAEGHGVLVERLDNIDGKMDTFETKIDILEMKMNTFETKMNTFETKMNTFETKINTLETRMVTRFDRLETEVAAIKHHIGLNGVSKPPG